MKTGGSIEDSTTLELSQRRWEGDLRRAWLSADSEISVLPRYTIVVKECGVWN